MNRLQRILAGLLLGFSAALFCCPAGALTVTVRYQASSEVLINPYIGNAVWASSASGHEQPFTLVYADLVWADFEPEQGLYDFASFEKKNHLALWREQGKKVIFRFVMDVPAKQRHRDIPEWLYRQTGQDGEAYRVPYGRGYSPRYENPILIEAHARAISALGERYGKDPFFAFVQIGSLGHWGEWHIHEKAGIMPPKEVREQYVRPYIEAFPDAKLMMRRPYVIAAENGMGLFNDTAGALKSTQKWLSWIEQGDEGGVLEDGADLLRMPEAWRGSPIGGELATDMKDKDLLGSQLMQTIDLFKRSHTSWIGPGSFSDVPRGGALQGALDQVLCTVGYRLRVDACTIEEASGGALRLTMAWKNDGTAPFYFDWQPALAITGADGTRTLYPLAMRLIEVQPGLDYFLSVTLTEQMLPDGPYTVSVGIIDPLTNEAGVALAMTANDSDLWYELLSIGLQR